MDNWIYVGSRGRHKTLCRPKNISMAKAKQDMNFKIQRNLLTRFQKIIHPSFEKVIHTTNYTNYEKLINTNF